MGTGGVTRSHYKIPHVEVEAAIPKAEVGNYVLQHTLGQGNFGKVKLATSKNVDDNKQYAIKLIEKIKLRKISDVDSSKKECIIMTMLNHPNIIVSYEFFETPIYHCLVMEYVDGGELFDYVLHKKRLDEDEARFLFRQLISALIYCHHHHVMHRDVKMENLLIDQNKHLKIIDFGLSSMYTEDGANESFVGTLYYLAPELLAGKKYSGELVDVWCSGCVLYIMLCGCFPFDVDTYSMNSRYKITQQIMQQELEYPPGVLLSANVMNLLEQCMCKDMSKRYTLAQIRSHPFITENNPILKDHIKHHSLPISNPCPTICEKILNYGYDDVFNTLQTSTTSNIVTSLYFLILNQPIRSVNKSLPKRPVMNDRSVTVPLLTPDLCIPQRNHRRSTSNLSLVLGYKQKTDIPVISDNYNCCEDDSYLSIEKLLLEIFQAYNIKYSRVGNFQFVCEEMNEDGTASNRFEVVICYVSKKNKYSVKIDRIRGKLGKHQAIKKRIMKAIEMN